MSERSERGRKSNARGAYAEKRTRDWLEAQGYKVAVLEKRHRFVTSDGRVGFSRSDIWACDLLAKSEQEIVFLQVKSSDSQIPDALRKLKKNGPWPPCARVWVVWWPPRRRSALGPEIEEYQ